MKLSPLDYAPNNTHQNLRNSIVHSGASSSHIKLIFGGRNSYSDLSRQSSLRFPPCGPQCVSILMSQLDLKPASNSALSVSESFSPKFSYKTCIPNIVQKDHTCTVNSTTVGCIGENNEASWNEHRTGISRADHKLSNGN